MFKLLKNFFTVVGGMREKAWYLSKVQWANIIALVSLALVNFNVIEVGFTTEQVNIVAAGVIPVVNMILRAFFTKVPLTKNVLPDGKVTEKLKEIDVLSWDEK